MSLSEIRVVQVQPEVAVVECSGEHDLTSGEEVRELLENLVRENELVVVDLSTAVFIDSSFMQNLTIAHRTGQSHGTRFAIQVGHEQAVRRALEVSGLLQVLPHADSREAALALDPVSDENSSA